MDSKDENNKKSRQRSHSPDVKSRAVVKYTAVQVPVEFAQLRCNTDLKMPPSNWLSSAADSYGLRHALSQSVGFSSFRMAHMFPDCVGEVDVVSGAECIKALLKLPYHPNGMISVMVHRIENTLLLDDFNILQYLMKPEWSWMKQFFYDNVIKSMRGKDKIMYVKNKTRFALQQKSLVSKFLYHSLIPSQSHEYEKDETKEFSSLPLPGPELPEPNVQENIPDPTFSNHTYNRNVVWTFEDIQMLIGSDMPIFGGIDRPCVSLRLRDASEPINVLTGIDYWLDNLMCNVPEVVMCYHLDGIVQKYEPIKTEDLPNLENSKFSPKVIRNVAQNILSFLKSNATKAGHTYWLFKGTHDDVVKLYDLTSLCGMTNNTSPTNDNPFTIPVAMLLYRVARNMRLPCQAGHIRMLLENCIKLLPIDKYPQIVASSHYMLANLYVPANTNPGNPCFKESSSSECECGDPSTCRRRDEEEDENDAFANSNKENQKTNNFEEKSKITRVNEDQNNGNASKQVKTTDSLFSKGVTVNSLKNPNVTTPGNPPPPTVDGRVGERCILALNHVKDGLDALKLMQKLNKEQNKNYKKREENKEEDDQKMAKPFEPIPMKYEPLNTKKPESESIIMSQQTEEYGKIDNTVKQSEGKVDNTVKQSEGKVDNTVKQSEGKVEKCGKKKKKRKQATEMITKFTSKQEHESVLQKQDSALLKKDKALPTWQGSDSEDTISWNIHLKILLYEKSCLSYATMAEQHYKDFQYGLSFKYILLAKKCQDISKILNGSHAVQDSCLLGRAGDNFFHFSKEWEKYQQFYFKQINTFSDVEQNIMNNIDKDIKHYTKQGENERELDVFDITELPNSMEEAMKASFEFYNEALEISPEDQKEELLRRIASVKNELGVKYMYKAQEQYNIYIRSSTRKQDKNKEPLFETYSKLSLSYLMESAKIFQQVKDLPNLALLHCNTGRFMRFRAHCNLTNHGPEQKKLYSQAVDHYGQALRLLLGQGCEGVRDLVKWELSTALYTQACLLQDSPPNVNDAATEAAEALRLALKNCPLTPGPRQCLYQFRAAILHHRLASLFHNQYRDSKLDVAKRKAMVTLSKINYEQAVKLLLPLEETTMCLTVQLEHVALHEYQANLNTGIKLKCLQSALELLQQSEPILKIIANRENHNENSDSANNSEKMERPVLIMSKFKNTFMEETEEDDDMKSEYKLLILFNQRLQCILKTLIQLCLQKHSSISRKECDQLMSLYKAMYSVALKIEKLDETHSDQFAPTILEALISMKNIKNT